MIYAIAIAGGIAGWLLYAVCMWDTARRQETPALRRLLPCGWKEIGYTAVCFLLSGLFAVLFRSYGYGPLKAAKYCVLLGGLVPIAYRDHKEKRIPNVSLASLALVRIVLLTAEALLYPAALADNLVFTFMGGLVSGGVMLLAYVISRHEIGMGDVKLFAVAGIYLGTSVTYVLIMVSLILAALYGIVKMACRRLKPKDEIAFAPFVAVGAFIVLGMGF